LLLILSAILGGVVGRVTADKPTIDRLRLTPVGHGVVIYDEATGRECRWMCEQPMSLLPVREVAVGKPRVR
jgi:hypothetical protein